MGKPAGVSEPWRRVFQGKGKAVSGPGETGRAGQCRAVSMVEVASCYGKEAAVARLQGLCPLRSVSLPSVSPPLRTASPRVPLPEAHIVYRLSSQVRTRHRGPREGCRCFRPPPPPSIVHSGTCLSVHDQAPVMPRLGVWRARRGLHLGAPCRGTLWWVLSTPGAWCYSTLQKEAAWGD